MIKKIFPLSQFWTAENGLTALLAFILLYFIVDFGFSGFAFAEFLALIFFSFVLLSGVLTVFDHPLVRLITGGLALVALISLWLAYLYPNESLASLNVVMSLLFFVILTAVVLTRVFKEGNITFHRICGAVAAYFLIGAIWANLYLLIALNIPDAFQMALSVDMNNIDKLQEQVYYFSFVTLTTLGFGDITPIHQGVRLLSMLEALIGQLYPAITLAWLVSMEIFYRTRQQK
jgi:hypothetical protein